MRRFGCHLPALGTCFASISESLHITMSTVPPEAAVTTDEPIANLLFDYPGADIILRSQDAYHFRVPKTSIINSSPILGEQIRKHLDSSGATNAEVSLTAIPLPESGKILHCLLTFIFFVTPVIPSTHEETMELLSVAQRYQMETALIHIRGTVARQNPLPTQLEPALRVYFLAQKYELRQEALQTARTILNYPMTIENFVNKLDIMPGAFLYELWKYYEEVRAILASDLTEFRESGAHSTITGLRCAVTASQIPSWLDQYIDSIGKSPNLFHTAEFSIVMARHIISETRNCQCASIHSQTIRDFWAALASVIHDSFEKAESVLSLVREHEEPQAQINPTISPLELFRVPDANLVIRSSDLVDFRVHKSVLAMASPIFGDTLSLPQPSDSEIVDGLPMIRISEDSELLNCLVSILYPVPTVIPNSYEKVLYLLAACQKYDMASVQSFIRAEVNRGEFPSPTGAEAFAAYAIASGKKLIPEMQYAARLTLDHPMTFEILGEGLRLFEGWALRDLANFRKRCRDNLLPCFESLLELDQPPFNVWICCTQSQSYYSTSETPGGYSPPWLTKLFQKYINESREAFSKPLFNPRRIQSEYFSALEAHMTPDYCISCTKVHTLKGVKFCKDLEDRLTQALSEVRLDLPDLT
ncbi:hypothetical protein F5888DRAFT_1054043 [Russula emetica]|nr:hypothetical protein F5888DRAFT_1054043 [Russula emetica]